MSRLLGIVLLYALMFLAWTGVGLFMLLAPVRFGNLIHDSFGLLPPVDSADRGKKLVLRLIGVALLAFATHFALAVAALVRQGG
jgi:hypothetical protein